MDVASRVSLSWLDEVVHAALYAVLGWLVGVYRPIFVSVFHWRHRNLRQRFGARAT